MLCLCDVVRRILIRHYRPGGDGPSWLTVIGHAKDSWWRADFFRCESILLKSSWIMVVMDVFTRRIIGFGGAAVDLDGPVICRMFNRAIAKQTPPAHQARGAGGATARARHAGRRLR